MDQLRYAALRTFLTPLWYVFLPLGLLLAMLSRPRGAWGLLRGWWAGRFQWGAYE